MTASQKKSKLNPYLPRNIHTSPCLEIMDSSQLRVPASLLFAGNNARDPQAQEARLSNQFITQNRGVMSNFGISADVDYNGSSVELLIRTGTRVGAFPLLSPTSGRPDYGLVIKPRFGWAGIGPMLGTMGWRVIPTPLKLPLLPHSDRKIPAWVLSSIILFRIKVLLEQLERRFEFVEMDRPFPKGNVNWNEYVTSRISSARLLDVPCRFPDLRDDRELKAAIHFTLRKQLSSLESQRSAGTVVLQLIVLCQSLLKHVQNVPPKQPSPNALITWYKGPLKTEIFREGLQAMEWTVDDRGLAGLGDLQGLPWVLSMEEFFEAWVETIVDLMSKRFGGTLKVGRKRETSTPLLWEPPYLGSQKYLLPDVVLEREEETIIFDAKYKDHWEEMSFTSWKNVDEVIREHHREDLLQVLAYSTLFSTNKIVTCLLYPCTQHTWNSLKQRNRLYHRATIPAGSRSVNVVLTAIPMDGDVNEAVLNLSDAIKL